MQMSLYVNLAENEWLWHVTDLFSRFSASLSPTWTSNRLLHCCVLVMQVLFDGNVDTSGKAVKAGKLIVLSHVAHD